MHKVIKEGFVSYKEEFQRLLSVVVMIPELHARWLNTLSYLENCGARKIAAFEHPTLVLEEILKHAAEEFRHSHYLKKQIGRAWSQNFFEDYRLPFLIGGITSLHYLKKLDVQVCRYLSHFFDKTEEVKKRAYLLVTYTIELRAGELYGVYEDLLKKRGKLKTSSQRVTVSSILLEEKEHLEEMEKGISLLKDGWEHARAACQIEGELCEQWVKAVAHVVSKTCSLSSD